ncbi:MAG: hypothetical protein HYR85_27905, partial [Planctomycetes bacterium]|nr:hypothetical protein [Planctomycetota bacterium]
LGAQVTLSAQNVGDPVQRSLFFRIWNEVLGRKALLTVDGSWGGIVHFEFDPATRRFIGPSGSVGLGQLTSALQGQGTVLTFTARLARPAEQPAPELVELRLDPSTPTFGTLIQVVANAAVDLTLKGRHFQSGATVFIDGRRSTIDPTWVDDQTLTIHIDHASGLPGGISAVQVQNPMARFSNELPMRTVAPAN